MHRSSIKRKTTETLLDYGERRELESEIKIEPAEVQFQDDKPLSDPYCCLCKAISELVVFDNGPKLDPDIAKKIQSCSGLEISSEANSDPHICRGCLLQLDGHYAFKEQALKSNEYAQNHMDEADAESYILPLVCRFCSKIGQKLLDMHPDGESPECDLLQKIRECLAIEVNSWDPVTKICRNCIKGIDDLFEFRTKHQETSVYIKDEIWHYDPSKSAKRIKQEDEDTSRQDLDLDLSVSDSDCSLEECQTVPACAGPLLHTGIDTTSTDVVSESEEMRISARGEVKSHVKKYPHVFRLLQQDDAERNFDVIKTGATFKVVQDKYEFRYYDELSDKNTVWKCTMDNMRSCKALAKITSDGKHLEISKGKHSHGTEVPEILRYPIGKRMIGEEPLWLLPKVSVYYESRYVVYKDNLFLIDYIYKKGDVRWSCHKRHSCRAKLLTKGNFQEVVPRNEHSHEKPPKSMITKMLNECTTFNAGANLSFKQKLLSYSSTKMKIWDEGENEYEALYILTDVQKDILSGFIFRNHRFFFSSVDQNETSRWGCSKYSNPKGKMRCRVVAIVEGLFESIVVAKQHTHEMMSDSVMEYLIKQYSSSSGEKVVNLEEIHDHKRSTCSILSVLARHDPERNFTMARAKTKLLVNFEGGDFRLKSRSPEGISTWSCVWLKMRKCSVSLHMSADGKRVSYVDPQKQHSHTEEQIGVFLQAAGKGQIHDKDNDIISSYWLFSYQCEFRSNRGIIFQGYKYTLYMIGNNGESLWRCRGNLCKVFVRVEGTFKAIFRKHEHIHARLTDNEIKDITGQEEIDKDLLPYCRTSNAIVPTSNRSLSPSAIVRIMSLNDPDRNFQIKIHKEEIKIIQEGFEFAYRSSTTSHTLWRCIYSCIRRCPVTLLIDNGCKQAFRPELPKHTHFQKRPNLYDYSVGESNIMDASTGSKKTFWFLLQPAFILPKPLIIFEDHRYWLAYIVEKVDNSKWYCIVRVCNAKLTVNGLFESVIVSGLHTHPPLAQDKKSELITLFGTSQTSPDGNGALCAS